MTIDEMVKEFEENCPFDDVLKAEISDILIEMGYFHAPASTRYHGCYEGGLYAHSKAVYANLLELTGRMGLHWEDASSIWTVAMLHDLCKCDQYRKTEDGWEYEKNTLLTGHGEKSLMLITGLPIMLTPEEQACIRYHMGAFTDKDQWSAFTGAVEKYPNVLWLHTADMMAAHFDKT